MFAVWFVARGENGGPQLPLRTIQQNSGLIFSATKKHHSKSGATLTLE
jgi:hypothetical protein